MLARVCHAAEQGLEEVGGELLAGVAVRLAELVEHPQVVGHTRMKKINERMNLGVEVHGVAETKKKINKGMT
jgi:hypothetical protein